MSNAQFHPFNVAETDLKMLVNWLPVGQSAWDIFSSYVCDMDREQLVFCVLLSALSIPHAFPMGINVTAVPKILNCSFSP